MRFACPHCHEPASRPVIKVGDAWIEDTDPDVNSGSVWCCSECHKPMVIEPQTPEEMLRLRDRAIRLEKIVSDYAGMISLAAPDGVDLIKDIPRGY